MKNTELLKDEHIETLGNNVGVVVSKQHTFGTDALLLSYFADPKRNDLACDLGTGCGIIPFLWARDGKCRKISAVEIQKNACNQVARSIEMNGLGEKIDIFNKDLKDLKGTLGFGEYDLVTMNPPYKAQNAGIKSKSENEKIARHETLCNINDIARTSASLLKFSGKMCVCIRPERIYETMRALGECRLEPKRLRFVTSRTGERPWLCLIEARLGGKSGMIVESNLTVYGDNGEYSAEMLEIVGKYREE